MPQPFPMLLQEVTVAVGEIWRDRLGEAGAPPASLTFVVLGTGIGESYNVEGKSLLPGSEVVLFLTQRPIGWREGGAKMLLTLSGGYQGVYRVVEGDRVECAGRADPSLARSKTIAELRRVVEESRQATAAPGR